MEVDEMSSASWEDVLVGLVVFFTFGVLLGYAIGWANTVHDTNVVLGLVALFTGVVGALIGAAAWGEVKL